MNKQTSVVIILLSMVLENNVGVMKVSPSLCYISGVLFAVLPQDRAEKLYFRNVLIKLGFFK